ncbi:hypothetical protein GBAR_LOCUS30411, partial [Geodia barretti]
LRAVVGTFCSTTLAVLFLLSHSSSRATPATSRPSSRTTATPAPIPGPNDDDLEDRESGEMCLEEVWAQ